MMQMRLPCYETQDYFVRYVRVVLCHTAHHLIHDNEAAFMTLDNPAVCLSILL
jgi:hypothetical protein